MSTKPAVTTPPNPHPDPLPEGSDLQSQLSWALLLLRATASALEMDPTVKLEHLAEVAAQRQSELKALRAAAAAQRSRK